MGGCRCVFRECTVATFRNPRMHFFHFPVKDRERLLQWVQMSGQELLLKLPLSQQKNRVVCARHFQDDCFMNYKKDRLTGKAIPTLMRLSDGLALDYSKADAQGGTPVLVTLEPTTKPHLIPPPGFKCPLELDTDIDVRDGHIVSTELLEEIDGASENLDNAKAQLRVVVAIEKQENKFKLIEPNSFAKNPEKRILNQNSKEAPPSKKPKILNSAAPSIVKEHVKQPISSTSKLNQGQELTTLDLEEQDLDRHLIIMDSEESNESLQFYEIKDINDDDEKIQLENDPSDNMELQETTILEPEEEEEEEPLCSKTIKNVPKTRLEKETTMLEPEAKKKEENTPSKRPTEFKVANVISLDKHNVQVALLKKELMQERSKYDNATKIMQERLQKLEDSLKNANLNLETTRRKLTESDEQTQNLRSLVELLEQQSHQLQNDNAKLDTAHETLRKDFASVETKMQALQATNDTLQQKCAKLQAEAAAAQQQVVSTSKESIAPVAPPVLPSNSLTSLSKAQLFNGIKKYLSASMVALVRMEMFGSSEREWKPDERRASVDLLRLGEHVFKYLSDEWRFRLPPLRQVHLWLNESGAVEDEEDL